METLRSRSNPRITRAVTDFPQPGLSDDRDLFAAPHRQAYALHYPARAPRRTVNSTHRSSDIQQVAWTLHLHAKQVSQAVAEQVEAEDNNENRESREDG